jgi:transcriptional regulator with XRE-family HTH domain
MDDLFHKRLAEAMEQRRRTLAEVADLFGITPQAVHDWVKGKTKPRPNKLKQLADFLEIDKEWLAWGEPLFKKNEYNSEDIGKAPATTLEGLTVDSLAEVFYHFRERGVGDYVFTRFSSPKTSFAIVIDDNSMDPELRVGDIAVFDYTLESDANYLVVARLYSLELTVIRRFEYEDAEHCALAPINPGHRRFRFRIKDEGKEFTIIGVLTEILRPTLSVRGKKRVKALPLKKSGIT